MLNLGRCCCCCCCRPAGWRKQAAALSLLLQLPVEAKFCDRSRSGIETASFSLPRDRPTHKANPHGQPGKHHMMAFRSNDRRHKPSPRDTQRSGLLGLSRSDRTCVEHKASATTSYCPVRAVTAVLRMGHCHFTAKKRIIKFQYITQPRTYSVHCANTQYGCMCQVLDVCGAPGRIVRHTLDMSFHGKVGRGSSCARHDGLWQWSLELQLHTLPTPTLRQG